MPHLYQTTSQSLFLSLHFNLTCLTIISHLLSNRTHHSWSYPLFLPVIQLSTESYNLAHELFFNLNSITNPAGLILAIMPYVENGNSIFNPLALPLPFSNSFSMQQADWPCHYLLPVSITSFALRNLLTVVPLAFSYECNGIQFNHCVQLGGKTDKQNGINEVTETDWSFCSYSQRQLNGT